MTALSGLCVVELCGERGAFAGKLFADMGADVVKLEPPGGDPTRNYPPFLEDRPGPTRSLYFWTYNTNKRSITLDLDREEGRDVCRRLLERADLLIEDRDPGTMASLGLEYADVASLNPGIIYVSITPFGRFGPRANEKSTDLTIIAGGGIAWMNGYDDHSLPPVRGGGGQGYHTGCHFAFMSALVALLHRDKTGAGQHIDVNMSAAANVTTEAGSYTWLVNGGTVQRQTGRHAAIVPTIETQVVCADGRYVNTGLPPRRPGHFGIMYRWLEDLGLIEDFPMAPFLEAGMLRTEPISLAKIVEDPEVQAIFQAGREAVNLIASKLDAYTFFETAQNRGLQVGIIYSPEEVIEDPHFKARDFPVEVEHPELGRSFTYPGAPYRFTKSPWEIRRRAPLLGEDRRDILTEIGLNADQIDRLERDGVV